MFLSASNDQGIFCFHKSNLDVFVVYITFASLNTDWLANFWRWTNLIGLFEFDVALSEILLAACTDQLMYKLNLIKLCPARGQ